jgi:hypothetical protein
LALVSRDSELLVCHRGVPSHQQVDLAAVHRAIADGHELIGNNGRR